MAYSLPELETIKAHAEKQIAQIDQFLATDTRYSRTIHDRKSYERSVHFEVAMAALGCMDGLEGYQDELAELIGYENDYYEALKPVRAALAMQVAA